MSARDIVFVILLNAIWGWNFVAVKYTVQDFSPYVSNVMRFVLVLLFVFPFLRYNVRGRVLKLMWVAVLMGVLHFGFLYLGMSMADGLSAFAIVVQLHVPMTTLLAIFMLREKVGLTRSLAIGSSFAGVVYMGLDPVVFSYVDALVVIAFSAFWYSLASIYLNQLKGIPPLTIQAWVALAGIMGSLTISLVMEDDQIHQLTHASQTAWLALLYTAIFSTLLGHGGMTYLLQKYEVSKVVPYFLLSPFFAISASMIVFDETLTNRMIVGGVLTFAGVAVITLRNVRRLKTAPTNADLS